MQSDDGGKSWTWPRVILDTAIDDRDSGVLETAQGTLLVTTFTSLAYESLLAQAEQNPAPEKDAWPLPPERLEAWRAAHRRLTPEQRKVMLGVWMLRSHRRRRHVVGPLPLPRQQSARAHPARRWPAALRRQGVVGGLARAGRRTNGRVRVDRRRRHAGGGSPTCPCGRVTIAFNTTNCTLWRPPTARSSSTSAATIRPTAARRCRANRPTAARPGGCHAIGVWGLPSHLLRLQTGHLLMTYGHRRPPFGNQGPRVSRDHGRTWSEPLIISATVRGRTSGTLRRSNSRTARWSPSGTKPWPARRGPCCVKPPGHSKCCETPARVPITPDSCHPRRDGMCRC